MNQLGPNNGLRTDLVIARRQNRCCGEKDPVLIMDDILEVIEICKLLFRVRHVDDFCCCT